MAGPTALHRERVGRSIVLRWLARMRDFALSASRRRNIILAFLPFGIALIVYLGAYFVMYPATITGDEPHYMLSAYSLVHDRDVDLRNNYEEDVGRFYPSSEIDPHAFDYRGNGRWISKHPIGLAILIAPVIFVHESVLAARVLFIVISALLAYQLFRLLQDLNIAEGRFLWPVWVAVVFSLPLLTFSNQIFPEIPAALLLVYGARAVIAKGSSRRGLFLAALGAAALPWLNVRFIVFTAGLTLGIAYRLLEGQTSWSGVKTSWRRLLLLAPIPVSGLLLVISFISWYGSPLPPGSLYTTEGAGQVTWTWSTLYLRGLGYFLSPSSGWLPFAPVHWLGIVGLVALVRIYGLATGLALVFVGAYLFVVTSTSHGYSFPARYLIALVPFVGIPLLLIVKASRPARVLFVGLLGLSLTIGVIAVSNHTDLYPGLSPPSAPGRTTLPLARELQDAWPIFAKIPTGFLLSAGRAQRQVGQLVTESAADTAATSKVAYATPASDPAGHLFYGPYNRLRPGTYIARFNIAAVGDQPADHVATLDIFALPPDEVLAQRELRLLDLPDSGGYATIEVPFSTPDSSYPLQTRVLYTGKAEVWVKSVEVVSTSQSKGLSEDFPSWPRSLLWVVGTAFVAFLVPWRGQSLRPTAWGSQPENGEPR